MPVDIGPPTEAQIESFETLKRVLLDPPILRLPVYGRPYTIDVDASKSQLGCVLLQEQSDGTLIPIGYWSRTLIPAELNYSTTERECLAVVWAVLHLRPYLERTRFTVRTDHHALKWALFLANAEGRLSKWRLQLAEYDFDVAYRPCIKHTVPDALSRLETTKGDTDLLGDEITCFAASDLEEGEWDDVLDNRREQSVPSPQVGTILLVDSRVTDEPILPEEWDREQSGDAWCRAVA